jgi:hypothetical protein
MIMVFVPMAPPGLALAVVPVVAAFAMVPMVALIVIAPGGRRRLSGRLRDDRRWSRGCDSPLRR